MSHHHDDKKKAKKALQLKKNRQQFEIFSIFRQRREEAARIKAQEEARASKPAEVSNDHAWGDKVSTVRNRLTDKKRVSRERWNRFAGTGGEGGRGL